MRRRRVYWVEFYSLSLKKYPEYRIVNFDLLTYAGNPANLADVASHPHYTFVQGDIADYTLVNAVMQKYQITHSINFAAESHVDRSIQDSAPFIHTNVVGVNSLLQAAKENGNLRFHHVSTDEVFGSLNPTDPPSNEASPYNPRSPYSASKGAADHLARAYFHTHNLPVTISNCSNNYGPYQFPEKLHGLFITNILEGKKIPVYGDGLQIRDWLYVSDHCAALDLILHQGKIGETYCVGGNSEKTNLEIAQTILKLAGKAESYIEHVTDRPGHDRRYAIDSSKIKRELGWEPTVSFEEGMRRTVAWYQTHQAWWQKLKKSVL